MNPSTRLSRRSSIAAVSASTSSSELARMRSNPAACATSEMPRVARAKKGFSMSPMTTPMVFDFPVFMLFARALGR
jgi:hypothetical protein